MAVYQFSALSDGQAIFFNATVDRLNFDQTAIAAGDLSLVQEGANLHVIVKSGTLAGKDIFLSNTVLEQVAGTNFTFVDGSVARVGDNSVGTTGDAAANVIAGGAGRDLLMGLGGNDNLQAGDNNDSLVGGSGNDTLSGNNGNDWMEGGTGNDTLNGGGGQDTFILREQGAANADLLGDFASGWDRIELDASTLTAIGAQGRFAASDARFFAGAAAHDADDRIIYNSATGQIFYDADGNGIGAAQLIATLPAGRGVVAGDFNVIGTPGTGGGNTINGTNGNDTLTGGPGNDTINGLAGNDSITGAGGLDSLVGGDGNDTVDGTSGNPSGFGEAMEADTLDGGLGDDTYIVGANDFIASDSGGVDTVIAWDTDWTLGAGLENLTFRAPDTDVLSGTGNELNNTIDPSGVEHGGTYHGLGGRDSIFGAQKDGTYFGDDGDDILDGSFNLGGNFIGGNGNDTLLGNESFGTNQLTGGAGSDSFVFLNDQAGGEITDFASGVDKIHLDARGNMNGLGTTGNFSAGDARFFAAAGATTGHDADDRVIYDTSTGNLYYDADGGGSGESLLIAIVHSGGAPAAVAANDIAVDNGTSGGSTINGGPGNDTLVGTAGNDTINGLGGDDSIAGLGGSDQLSGGDGNDTLNAGSADSPSNPDGAPDTLDGGLGDDVYEVYEPGDTILADPQGTDLVRAINVDWTLGAGLNNLDLVDTFGSAFDGTGNELNNVIRSASEGGRLAGLGGNDLLIGRNAQNTVNLEGGDGNDTLQGGWHTDFDGGAGNDLLIASVTEDNMIGGAGADIFHFGAPDFDFIQDFGSGVDKIRLDGTGFTQIGASGNFAAGDARFFAGADAHDADDRVIWDGSILWYDPDGTGATAKQSIAVLQAGAALVATDITVINGTASGGQTINGTTGNDSLVGGAGNDTINGNAGNDTLVGGAGDDSLTGGSGTDSMDGGLGNDIFVVFDSTDILSDSGGIDLIYTPISWALGSAFENITITGTASATVSGNFMSNIITGNAAANTLRARDGNDTVTGGGGADFFDFTTAPSTANADTITDFVSGTDRLRFDDGVHAGIGATGNWAATDGRFYAAAGASAGHDASDRVVYNTSTGQLFYDADGSGSGAAVLVATLQGAPGVSATDISVI